MQEHHFERLVATEHARAVTSSESSACAKISTAAQPVQVHQGVKSGEHDNFIRCTYMYDTCVSTKSARPTKVRKDVLGRDGRACSKRDRENSTRQNGNGGNRPPETISTPTWQPDRADARTKLNGLPSWSHPQT